LVPALDNLAVPDYIKRRTFETDFLPGSRETKVVASMRSCGNPANGDMLSLGDDVLQCDTQVRESAEKCLVDRLEALRPFEH
jgi:hypothetical protein